MPTATNNQIRKLYQIGNSVVVAIAPSILRSLKVDTTDGIFVEESLTENGEICLKLMRLNGFVSKRDRLDTEVAK
jgi:hypothetical protein